MNEEHKIEKPIFFVGMGRSGTTILFEELASNDELAWPSNYCEWFPSFLSINAIIPLLDKVNLTGHKKQYGKALPGNRYLPQPDEAYRFWDYYTKVNFSRSYLNKIEASSDSIQRTRNAVSKLLYFRKKQKFSAKFTGPGRINYLASIFPDAHFIHIIRDGRAVVESLLRQKFWKEKGGFNRPFWHGTPENIVDIWKKYGSKADVLAAIQWRYIIESIRDDINKLPNLSYMEVRYEDYIDEPNAIMKSIYTFTGLTIPDNDTCENKVSMCKNMNRKWKDCEKTSIARITEVMQPLLNDLGYV